MSADSDPALTYPALTYPIVDTNQTTHFGDRLALRDIPADGEPYFGQDAAYDGAAPGYVDNGDGTVTDTVTGLMWQSTPTANVSYAVARAGAATTDTGGYDDWRLPTIKELYSLMDFSGRLGMTAETSEPYIDDSVFAFSYGDTTAGERFIDAQYWSSTEYVGTTMGGQPTTFGVNFADGRIKGYPAERKLGEVLYVRGNPDYGENAFVDRGDGTVIDTATGLMWLQADSGVGMTWSEALAWAEGLEVAGYDDWRLPNAKELHAIIDYSRAPNPTDPTPGSTGPAVDPVFSISNIGTGTEPAYPYLWTSTTLETVRGGDTAVYFAAGEAGGWMETPATGEVTLMDVHGAGAQRSDPKTGDPADYPYGRGPQGDVITIENFALAVRDVEAPLLSDADPVITDGPVPDGGTVGGTGPIPLGAVVGLTLAILGGPASATVLLGALSVLNDSGSLNALADHLVASDAFADRFAGLDTRDDKLGVVLDGLGLEDGSEARDMAQTYFINQLSAGAAPGQVLLNAVSYLMDDTIRSDAFASAAEDILGRISSAAATYATTVDLSGFAGMLDVSGLSGLLDGYLDAAGAAIA